VQTDTPGSPIPIGFAMFLGSAGRCFSVPACGSAACRAQRRSRLAEGHRLKRREAVLTAVSTARASITSGKRTPQFCNYDASQIEENQEPRAGGVTAPPISALLYGRKPHHMMFGASVMMVPS
jgi:hypothetical protein